MKTATQRSLAAKEKMSHRSHTRIPEVYEASDKAKAEAEALLKQLHADYRTTFNTEAGVRVLRDLVSVCGQNKTSVCGSIVDGTLDPIGTLHNEAMRKVYLHIRQYLTPSTLAKVENNGNG